MQAVILCGGRGERLMPLTACRPAALLRITGDTVLNYALKQLKSAGFETVTLAMGYLEGMIVSSFDSCEFEGMKIKFLSAEGTGTAGALAQAFDGEDMLVIESNCIFNFNLKKLTSFHTINKSICTIATKKLSDLSSHTCFSADDNNRIVSVSNNPSNDNLCAINAFTGIYIISKNTFSEFSFINGDDFVTDTLPEIIAASSKVYMYNENGYWNKITDGAGFLKAQQDMLSGKTGIRLNARIIQDGIYSETSNNFNGVSIISPVYIGKNVTIDKGSVIEPYSVIDDNAVIGPRVRISGSYVGQNAVILARSELTESVICTNALIKKSVHCGENSIIGEKAVVGDSARIEDNIKVWAGKEVAPNSVISRHIIIGSGKDMHLDDDGEFNFGNTLNAPSDFARFGMAVGTAFNKKDIIIVGYSGNNSSKVLTESLISGLVSTGIKVFNMGKCTNQQVMFGINRLSGNAGCFVSADYSEKVRITDKGGLPLLRMIERKIENAYNGGAFRTLNCQDYGKCYDFSGTSALYEIFLDSMLPEKFNGINAEIRCSSREIAVLADEIINPRNDLDGEKIIFHISADGSSCSAYTDKTSYVFHERLILLAMKISFQKGIPVSVPFSFPIGADSLAETEEGRLYRYYNSPDDSSDESARETAQRSDNFFVRDGLVLACTICDYLSESNTTFSQAINDIPRFSSIQRYVSVNGTPIEIIEKFASVKAGWGEGVVFLKEKSRALIRPMKSGEGLMIFAESFKSEEASAICDEIQEKLKKYENNSN